MRLMKKSFLLGVLFSAFLFVTPVFASADENRIGSITIKLQDTAEHLSRKDVSLALVQVADVEDGRFRLKEEYTLSGVDLNEVRSANELEIAAEKLVRITDNEDQILTTDEYGVANAEQLPVGVYLIYATDIKNYENITPFLVSIPSFDDEKGVMQYDVEVMPKHASLPHQELQSLPQTGFENKALEYGVLSVIFLVISGGIAVILFVSEKKKRTIWHEESKIM